MYRIQTPDPALSDHCLPRFGSDQVSNWKQDPICLWLDQISAAGSGIYFQIEIRLEPDMILFPIRDPTGTRFRSFCQIKIRKDPDLGKQWSDNAGSGVWIRYITSINKKKLIRKPLVKRHVANKISTLKTTKHKIPEIQISWQLLNVDLTKK